MQFPQMKGRCVTLQFLQKKFVLVTLTVAKSWGQEIFLAMNNSKARLFDKHKFFGLGQN
jgi:hypothetical protein